MNSPAFYLRLAKFFDEKARTSRCSGCRKRAKKLADIARVQAEKAQAKLDGNYSK